MNTEPSKQLELDRETRAAHLEIAHAIQLTPESVASMPLWEKTGQTCPPWNGSRIHLHPDHPEVRSLLNGTLDMTRYGIGDVRYTNGCRSFDQLTVTLWWMPLSGDRKGKLQTQMIRIHL